VRPAWLASAHQTFLSPIREVMAHIALSLLIILARTSAPESYLAREVGQVTRCTVGMAVGNDWVQVRCRSTTTCPCRWSRTGTTSSPWPSG
jgi:hypothetical protein